MAAERDTALRLRAYLTGTPIRRLEHRPVPVPPQKDRMLAAFVRMGGESSPWAIGWRRGRSAIEIRTVPEARRRSDVAAMVAEFGDELCAHFGQSDGALRQLWVPGGTHAELLHFIALRYSRAKKADPALLERLNRAGRRAGLMFDATQNPNSVICIDLTARLREIFAFPCEPVRESHLGYLIAWLGAGGSDQRALRAKEAEALPVSTSLDPELERGLAPAVEAWNEAQTDAARQPHAARIRKALEGEIRRRLELLEAGLAIYDEAAGENPGAKAISSSSMQELARFESSEEYHADGGFARSPETDHSPTTAAMSYAHKDADMIAARAALVPFDRACQDELIAEGSAFRGDVLAVDSVVIGSRTHRKQLTVVTDGALPLRLREQDSVVIAGDSNGKGVWEIAEIEADATERSRTIRLVATQAHPTGPMPRKGAVGVVFHEKLDPELRRRLARMVVQTKDCASDGSAPGAWILEKLAAREPADGAPETEQFDGTTTKVVENG